MTSTEIANLALGKLGGAGDVLGGNAFITSIDGTDKVSSWCKLNFPRARRRAIEDLAIAGCPFRSTVRFGDLGAAVADDDLPEIGEYQYAFNLPDCLAVVRQFNENYIATRQSSRGIKSNVSPIEYQWEQVANRAGTGKILLTNTLSNVAGTSAFIEYVIDTPATGGFSEGLIECIATLLASGVCPIVGRDTETSAALLAMYLEVAVPNAMAANQGGFNNTIRPIPDFSGGRSGGVSEVRLPTDLGTYVNHLGVRTSI